MGALPPEIVRVLRVFEDVFSERVWDWVQVLVVGPGAESAPAAGGGRGVRAEWWAGPGRARRDDRAAAWGEDRGEGDLPRPGAVEQEPLRQGERAALDLDAGAGRGPG